MFDTVHEKAIKRNQPWEKCHIFVMKNSYKHVSCIIRNEALIDSNYIFDSRISDVNMFLKTTLIFYAKHN